MKVDTSFPQAPIAAAFARPVQGQAAQTSTRPVDRPHHDEAADNRQPPSTTPQAEARGQDVASSRGADASRHHATDRSDDHSSAQQQAQNRNATEPSRVGELLDVLA